MEDKQRNTLEEIESRLKMMSLEKFSFETVIGQAKGPVVTIEKLVDTKLQDPSRWADRFKSCMELSGIEDEKAMKYLTFCVAEEYYEKIEDVKSLDSALKILIGIEYNKDTYKNFLDKLKHKKLRNGTSVSEYKKQFDSLVEKVNKCLLKKDKLLQREEEDYFLNGLPLWMQEEYIKLTNTPIKERIKILDKLEKLRARRYEDSKTNKHSSFNNKYRENQPTDKKAAREYNEIITEKEANINQILFKGMVNGIDADILLDTGASRNYISEKIAKQIKAKREKKYNCRNREQRDNKY